MRRKVDPLIVEQYARMYGVGAVEAAQRRLAEEDEQLDMAKAIGIKRHPPVVYYMRMDRLVKIGVSTHLAIRVSTIMPQGVMAIEFGDRNLERDRHAQFVRLHSHGEWFWLRDALVDHVLDVRARFEAEQARTVESWLVEHRVGCAFSSPDTDPAT